MADSITSDRQETVAQLLATHTEFRKLHRKHQMLESRLDEFDRKGFLTPDEELTRKQLQKEKLLEKDRMELIIRQHHSSGASAA